MDIHILTRANNKMINDDYASFNLHSRQYRRDREIIFLKNILSYDFHWLRLAPMNEGKKIRTFNSAVPVSH